MDSMHEIGTRSFTRFLWRILDEVVHDLNSALVYMSISRQSGQCGVWVLSRNLDRYTNE